MDSLQLFTMLLLAVAAIHLLFSAVEVIGRWLTKDYRAPGLRARGAVSASSSGWYVFFDPADLYGRPLRPGTAKGPRKIDGSRTSQAVHPHKNATRRPRVTA